MTKALPFTQAGIGRAIAAAQRAGLRVVGIRAADGTVLVQDGDEPVPGLAPISPPGNDAPASKWEDVEA